VRQINKDKGVIKFRYQSTQAIKKFWGLVLTSATLLQAAFNAAFNPDFRDRAEYSI